MKHERDKLRFEAKMIKCAPEDANRRFILTYHVADDTVSLYEQMDRNNGLLGGKFLERSRMPGIDPSQLAVGKEVCVNSFHFRLTATDEATLKYMEARPKEFSIADANKILKKLREMILAKHVRLRDAFRSIDTDHSGSITFEEFRVLCRSLNMELIDQEIITLMRYFDRDHDGLIGYADFCDVVLPSNDYASGKAEILDAASLEAMTEAQKMEMEHKQKAMQMAAFKTFRARFEQRRLFYMDAFRIATDASPDSRIGRDELLHVIRRTMKLDASLLKDSEFEALSGAFFSNGRDRIDLADFFKIIDGTDTWQLVNEGGKKH
jgi:Ca2+-binding EF-hand superfamily protein